ncbi:MAG TPA: alpha/beta hydrolase [Kofleriaceae bacterium]|nr:alpha/beta hydrolase [Kofleriaceae bacterium]
MRLVPLVAVLASCQPAPPVAPAAHGVTGHLVLAPAAKVAGTRGPLFVTWLTVDEMKAFATNNASMQLLRDVVTRAEVVPDVDARAGVTYTAHPGHGPAIVILAVVDLSHRGIVGLFGAGDSLQGGSAPFAVTDTTTTAPPITLTPSSRGRGAESCVGPALALERIDDPAVAGTVGNNTSRRACVLVPKSYASHPERHYPVIYVFPGLAGDDQETLDDLDRGLEAIVIAVDTSTKTGSTYLVDSPTSGAWDSFFTTKLVPYIDAHYRTLPHREARALMGHSTGGFNAMSYGLRHPDLVGVIASSSPDGLDFSVWLGSGHVPAWIRDFARVEHDLGGAGQFISYAADWSPSASGFDWPFDASGAIVDHVMARWIANTPGAWLRDPARVAAFKPLAGHIYLTVGDTDEFDLHAPTVAFSNELTAAGIANELVITHGGHGTHEHDQMKASFGFCASKLEAAR